VQEYAASVFRTEEYDKCGRCGTDMWRNNTGTFSTVALLFYSEDGGSTFLQQLVNIY
jgi:hypothetical protein